MNNELERRVFISCAAAATSLSMASWAQAETTRPRIKVGQIGTKHAHALGQ